MTRFSRRAFLRLLLAGGTLIAVAGGLARRFGRSIVGRWYRALVAFPDNTQPGPLSPETSAVLMALARALLPPETQLQRYEAQFRWRAANRGGYLDLYNQCAHALNQAAHRAAGVGFKAAPAAVQARIVERFADVRRLLLERRLLRALPIVILAPEWLRFERYISRDLLALFAQTDAWVLAGYASHPGVPRGLETYRQEPSSTA